MKLIKLKGDVNLFMNSMIIYEDVEGLKRYIFIQRWIEVMKKNFLMTLGDRYDEDKVNRVIDKALRHIYLPRMRLVNNYLMREFEGSLLDIYDFIIKKKPIIGGNGVLFSQHGVIPNPQATWISNLMAERKGYKKKMFNFPKGSKEYKMYDLLQLNTKIKINSLYGVLGYLRFMLYNIFLAQCVTSTGQNIISSAACGFESFIAGDVGFVSMGEVRRFIDWCNKEVEDESIQMILSDSKIPQASAREVSKHLKSQCHFRLNQTQENIIDEMVMNSSIGAIRLMRYKNSLIDFIEIPFIANLIEKFVLGSDGLMAPDIDAITSDEAKDALNTFWEYCEVFVMMKHPFYDRVRRNKYEFKRAVIYEDTDSNFLSLGRWVRLISERVVHGNLSDGMRYSAVNTYTIILGKVITSVYRTLTDSLNIQPSYGERLQMKNEFYYPRILFVDTKKRYIGLQELREGKKLKGNIDDMDVKGFEFKKSITKETLRNYYTQISYELIMKPEEIDSKAVLRAIMDLEKSIRTSLSSGETIYFKQANVKRIEEYAKPYSIPGVKAIYLWNALCPDYQLELPTDVDIVPIKLEKGRKKLKKQVPGLDCIPIGNDNKNQPQWMFNDTKFILELARKYPDMYMKLDGNIFRNSNENIRSMGLNFIAKPKNPLIPIPDWFYEIIDYNQIVNDSLKLYYPILETLGIRIIKTGQKTEHYTNMVML